MNATRPEAPRPPLAAALPVTTVPFAATGPKLPPFVGD